MQAATTTTDGALILYDAAQSGKVHGHVFTPSYWRARGALSDPLGGRGAAWRITVDGTDWVLRFYRRGGLPGRFILDRYLFTGLERTRPWREWRLLQQLHELGLPVPRPVAARVMRGGLLGMTYRGALITQTVPGISLAQRLREGLLDDNAWRAVGACIRRLHDAGAWHADLNANNILLTDAAEVHVIDFDRGRLRPQDTAWREANLARLRRSLDKLAGLRTQMQEVVAAGWPVLLAGYRRD